jgi:DNA-binding NarL/FixJ family response regulator
MRHVDGDPIRVLVVEDHDLVASTLALALGRDGIDVHIAMGPSGHDVVELARSLAPVLVLLDLNLGDPLGSGLDLIAPLRSVGARVVMMTGVTDPVRLAACVEAGAMGIISKASRFDELVETVRRAARGATLLSSTRRHELLAALRAHRALEQKRLAPFASLSPRERAVLARLVQGDSAETIAAQSYVSLATVRSQIRSILAKLGVTSQLAAVAMARQAGWPPPGSSP